VELRRLGLTGELARGASDRYVEGLTLVEIAAELGVAASTIRRSLLGQG
jgi:DNA-directed RNA polymerase specialized sigma24 family protein